jgi:hypothetical protein
MKTNQADLIKRLAKSVKEEQSMYGSTQSWVATLLTTFSLVEFSIATCTVVGCPCVDGALAD